MGFYLSSTCYTKIGFAPQGYGLVIDWGYKDTGNYPVNMAINALLLTALVAMHTWSVAVGDSTSADKYAQTIKSHTALLCSYLKIPSAQEEEANADWVLVDADVEDTPRTNASAFDPTKLGFHAAAFALRCGILGGAGNEAAQEACCDYLKSRLNTFFPLNKSAPRLSDPSKRSTDGFYVRVSCKGFM